MNEEMKLPFPRLNFGRLRKLIRAYYEIEKDFVSTREIYDFIVKDINFGDISSSSIFLCSINILEKTDKDGTYKLTKICKELGKAIKNSDKKKESEILNNIVDNNDILSNIKGRVNYIQEQKHYIEDKEFKELVIKLAGWEEKSKSNSQVYSVYALAITDIFKDANIAKILKKKKLLSSQIHRSEEFINSDYINELDQLNPTKEFDLTRLINYCNQINSNYEKEFFESVAFLSRALIHHIPPIFKQKNFQSLAQVSSGNDNSFKKSCNHLQESLKHIVDDLIHQPIKSSVTPIAKQEINFSQDLNRLLRGIIDELRSQQ